jgi:hypothetical protein
MWWMWRQLVHEEKVATLSIAAMSIQVITASCYVLQSEVDWSEAGLQQHRYSNNRL